MEIGIARSAVRTRSQTSCMSPLLTLARPSSGSRIHAWVVSWTACAPASLTMPSEGGSIIKLLSIRATSVIGAMLHTVSSDSSPATGMRMAISCLEYVQRSPCLRTSNRDRFGTTHLRLSRVIRIRLSGPAFWTHANSSPYSMISPQRRCLRRKRMPASQLRKSPRDPMATPKRIPTADR